MKKIIFLLLIFSIQPQQLFADSDQADTSIADTIIDEEVVNSITDVEPNDIVFSYDNTDIIDIINSLASLKNLNVILPPADILNVKVSIHFDEKMTLSQAWNILNTLLDIAGFFIVPQGSLIRVVRSGKEISREPMPTYIGTDPQDLPNTDQPIRYLYYLANIKVSDQPENEIFGILRDLLPDNTFFKADSVTNSLLLIAKANDIRSVMKIVAELDTVGFQEKVDIISLRHTSAEIVARLINEELIRSENVNPYRLDTKKAKEVPYFSGFTKIVPENRLNKLIILGRPQAIERLKDFIRKHIDVAPDSGKSILHIYKLQYLDANKIADVLRRIVEGGGNRGPSQASAGFSSEGGVERFFNKIIIETDSPKRRGGDRANTEVGSQQYQYYGGNNLIIAARNDDWKQIKKLIEELDIPQTQVLLEVLIADLTADDARILGAMTRIPDKVPFPDSMAFQSALLGPAIPSEISNNPPTPPNATINADLLRNAYTAANTPTLAIPSPSDASVRNLAQFVRTGTTLLSLNDNDGETWSILEILQSFTNSKILSHPHVMTKNNEEAMVSIGQTRWLQDQVKDIASNYYGGATTIKRKPIAANLMVRIKPLISSDNTVNLQVFININEWQGNTNTKTIRNLETNANVKSGGIFALGGLIRTTTNNVVRETPILGKIPVLGWFFKRKNKEVIKNNLTVFISPTIIQPRLRQGVDDYTQDYIDVAKNYAGGEVFDSLKDPITRWFFRQDVDIEGAINKFTSKDEGLVARRIQEEPARLRKEYSILDDQREEGEDDESPLAKKAGIDITYNEQGMDKEAISNTIITIENELPNDSSTSSPSTAQIDQNIQEIVSTDAILAHNQEVRPTEIASIPDLVLKEEQTLMAYNEIKPPIMQKSLKEIIGNDASPFERKLDPIV